MRKAGINLIIIGLIFIYQINLIHDFTQNLNMTNLFNSTTSLDNDFASKLKNLQTNLKGSGLIQLVLLILSGISLIIDERNYTRKQK